MLALVNNSKNMDKKTLGYLFVLMYSIHFNEKKFSPLWIREYIERLYNFRRSVCIVEMNPSLKKDYMMLVTESFMKIFIKEITLYFDKYKDDPLVNELNEVLKNVEFDFKR